MQVLPWSQATESVRPPDLGPIRSTCLRKWRRWRRKKRMKMRRHRPLCPADGGFHGRGFKREVRLGKAAAHKKLLGTQTQPQKSLPWEEITSRKCDNRFCTKGQVREHEKTQPYKWEIIFWQRLVKFDIYLCFINTLQEIIRQNLLVKSNNNILLSPCFTVSQYHCFWIM